MGMNRVMHCLQVSITLFCASSLLNRVASAEPGPGDAFVKTEGNSWTFGSSSVQRTVTLADGALAITAFTDRATGRDLLPRGHSSDPFVLLVGPDRKKVSGMTGGWKLVNAVTVKGPVGEQTLSITLEGNALRVAQNYQVYPGSSVIREWLDVRNAGAAPLVVSDPQFLRTTVAPGELGSLQFNWMSGAENVPGSWLLKTESLKVGKTREFDSFDPFPAAPATGVSSGPGDGVDARVQLNDRQIWPPANANKAWEYLPNAAVTTPFDVSATVAAGDRLIFRVNMHGNIGWDTTAFDPTITYTDGDARGEAHSASKEFSDQQGKNGWRYQYLEDGKFIDLVYYPGPIQNWRKAKDNATHTPFVDANSQHPDVNQDAVRVWTAPHAGTVQITGSACNTGNHADSGGGGSSRGMKPGSSSYAPWYALYSKETKQGVFIGFDYFGHWASGFEAAANGAVAAHLEVAGFHATLAPGESINTPKGFVGLFHDDLDNAGNELLDWQYRYLWDYTRDGGTKNDNWFPALRTLGFWMRGTGWGKPGVAWTGGKPDMDSLFRKIFRTADYMRYTGVDVYHRDWGWWDVAGDWNGPDFRTTGAYLRKYGMGQLIYAFLYTVDRNSKVARAHPDWVLPNPSDNALDLSRSEVAAFIQGQLEEFVKRWGDFEWRNDSFFTAQRNGDDTPLLKQDAAFREILRNFLTQHPGCAFQAVNGGGNYAGYDYVRYASTLSFSDGAVGPVRNYYAALLFPPDKTSDIPDIYNPDAYDKATWRGLLTMNYDTTGDTWDADKLEGIRLLNDIYHYLLAKGVVGRGVHVFRPSIEGDDPTMYFQRMSADGHRGIIIPKRTAAGSVAIRPKGLLPGDKYAVSYQESDFLEERTGEDLMRAGVVLKKMLPGELIYLNLPLHPGSKLDKQPPTPPSNLRVSAAENLGYPGVELTWDAGADDTWVSYYEVSRNGIAIDKVAKGMYYFDHSAGADVHATYALRTVDGAGNASVSAASTPAAGSPAVIFDDAGPGLRLTGNWKRANHLQPADAGTISESNTKGDTADLQFEGKHIVIVCKLGPHGGKASVQFDDAVPATTFDTFSADDIWGVGVYRKEFPSVGKHTMHLTVLGEHVPLSDGNAIAIDGVRAEAG